MRTPNNSLANTLLSFLRSAKDTPSIRKIARDGIRIDPGVKSLLDTFPGNLFWSAFRNLTSVDDYPTDPKGVLHELEFEDIKYPFATKFAHELKTWLGAIGCTEIDCGFMYNFTQATSTNILSLASEYNNGNLSDLSEPACRHKLACRCGTSC